MPKNRLSLSMDVRAALRKFEGGEEAVEDGASNAVRQLAVLAEGAMKAEAPEGAGADVHLRDTIDTRFRRNGLTANVGARKTTDDGDLLAAIIVDGTDASSYGSPPPLAPLVTWASAKLTGDPVEAAQNIRWSIFHDGHETFPNDFVDRSLTEWESQVEDVAGEQVRDALSRLMGGA